MDKICHRVEWSSILWVSPLRAKSVLSIPILPGLFPSPLPRATILLENVQALWLSPFDLWYTLAWKYSHHHYYLCNQHKTIPIANVVSIKFNFKKLWWGWSISNGLSFTLLESQAISWHAGIRWLCPEIHFLCSVSIVLPPPFFFNSSKTLNWWINSEKVFCFTGRWW